MSIIAPKLKKKKKEKKKKCTVMTHLKRASTKLHQVVPTTKMTRMSDSNGMQSDVATKYQRNDDYISTKYRRYIINIYQIWMKHLVNIDSRFCTSALAT